jgi:hypothetical protein
MAIAKKPLRDTSDTRTEPGTRRHLAERAAESFIEGRDKPHRRQLKPQLLICY